VSKVTLEKLKELNAALDKMTEAELKEFLASAISGWDGIQYAELERRIMQQAKDRLMSTEQDVLPRETRLINKSTFDDPSESCLAGSTEEFDLIAEWDRCELVETIQLQDAKLFDLQAKHEALQAKHEALLNYLPKVPTEPYEKELARKLAVATEALEKIATYENWSASIEAATALIQINSNKLDK
jgi:hypothetical protein